mgnify:CR=1 FL=1
MTQIEFPSGDVIDFEDASEDQIKQSVTVLRQKNPELFEEGEVDYSTLSFEEIAARGSKGVDQEEIEEVKTTHEGEVKDLGLQYFVGRGDTDEERQARLVSVFGEEGVTKVGADDFVLNLDTITEDIKEKYGLPQSGTIRFNEPGLSWQDVSGFLGRETVPLVAALGASVAATGLGAPAGIGLVALAGAAGKAVDEFIFEDIFEGLQRQDTGDILKDVALQALIEGGGEGLGRGAGWLIKRSLRGKGPPADPVRVAELKENYIAQGMSEGKANRLATKASREETAAMFRQMIDEGANLPAITVTGKSILGRTQAIWESIFPNEAAVSRNVAYVNDVLKKHQLGDISTDEAKKLIADTADSMAAKLAQSMADPDQAIKQANKELKDVLEKEFDTINKVLERSTAGSEGLASEFQRGMELATKLFTARSNTLYRNADDLLTGETVNLRPLQDQLKVLQGDPLRGGEQLNGAIFQHILKTPDLSISDIPALRSALRATEAHPDLLGTTAGANIKKLLDTLDTAVKKKEVDLAEELERGLGGRFAKEATAEAPARPVPYEMEEGVHIFPGGKVPPLAARSPSEVSNFREGLDLLSAANKHYQEGAEIINSGMIQQLNQLIKDKNMVDFTAIVGQVVQPNQPQLLKFVLDAITPSGKDVNKIIEVGRANPGFFAGLSERIRTGDITGVNQALDDAGLGSKALEKAGIKSEKNLLTVPEVFARMAPDDPTRLRLQNDFAETLTLYDEMANAAGRPGQFREGYRNLMAKNWLDSVIKVNPMDDGTNYKALAQSFDSLGTKVQNELFGKEAGQYRQIMNDLKLLDRNSAAKLNEFTGDIANQDARTIVDTFKNVIRQSEVEGQDAFLRAIRGGPLDADKLVTHVLKNPKNYDTLRARVGDEMLDSPGGFKDLVLERIVSSGFPTGKVTSDVVQSGAFGQAWLKSIKDLNQAGALEKILGKEAVVDLNKIAKAGEAVSDSVLKGKTGLAAAGYAAGFSTALILNPIATLSGAATIIALSRALRSKPILKYLSSPRLRAYEAERAMRGGAELGKRNIAAEKARESAVRSLRTILVDMGYYASGVGGDILSEEIIEPAKQEAAPVVQQGQQAIQPVVDQVSQQVSQLQPPPQIPPRGAEVLREIEQQKMLRGYA